MAARREAARTPDAVGSTDSINAVLVQLKAGVDPQQFADSVVRWKHLAALTQEAQETVLSRSVVERARRQIGLFTSLLLVVSTVIIGTILFQSILTTALPVTSQVIEGDISETARLIIQNGMILYALTRMGGARE